MKSRDIVNKNSKAISDQKPKKLRKKVRNYSLFFCGSLFTNAPIKKPKRLQKLKGRDIVNKKIQKQFQIRKPKNEQKSRKTILHSFLDQVLPMHLFKKQTDFNKLKG